jgi:hypothetical protein
VTLDPIDPGAMPISAVVLTTAQTLKLAEIAERHRGPIRVEKLPDAYVRAVLIGRDGEPVSELLLFPV